MTRTKFRQLVGPSRAVEGAVLIALTVVGGAWATGLQHQLGFTFFNEQYLGLFLALGLAPVFISVRASPRAPHDRVPWYDWLLAAGAIRVWGSPPKLGLSAGQHQAGTCRMGDDPRISVVDRWGRVHGHDNLFVADASVHVTNGGFNPVLTIMALAFRTAEHIAQTW